MDCYQILGVSPDATPEDIRIAYRNLAKKYHPDNYVGNPLADLASEKMKEINQAYDAVKSGAANPTAEDSSSDDFTIDPYEVLGISPDATVNDIKLAHIMYMLHHKGDEEALRIGKIAYAFLMKDYPDSEDTNDSEYMNYNDSYTYETYEPEQITYHRRDIIHTLPVLDFLLSSAFFAIMTNVIFRIHPAFCFLIGIGVGIVLALIFMTRVGNWILSVIYSLIWGYVGFAFGCLLFNGDKIWMWTLFGIVTFFALLYHKTHSVSA
ncbi:MULTISPECIES: DnaJ domain-containing protein [Caproicibacterium]|uniref:DnaJ domain-containing protein n=1 Tax=Caproicibacterium argilliputei TaxID=3030016 RepID=A0AA97H1U8_9FIRM|nr:DnaJ domain-containing protein [Caproicibacterium argilliputei]WOC32866.1 DnaJ domain-containing protein [Caproicibacterium argilliputei]